jgi:uncharacterized membrane protein
VPVNARTIFRWAVFTALASALIHVVVVAVMPWMVMKRVFAETGDRSGYNRMIHAAPVDAAARMLPRPAPDLAYSICPFDLAAGPVRIVFGVPGDRASVTAYGGDTENFLTLTGADLAAGEVTLATEAQVADLGGRVVVAPGERGVVLIRRLVRRPADWESVERERADIACGPA